jgi:hypothetical protein
MEAARTMQAALRTACRDLGADAEPDPATPANCPNSGLSS